MLVPLLFLSWFVGALIFIFTLFRAHAGSLFSIRTLCRCSSSFFSSRGLEHTALMLWYNMLTTLFFFAAVVWWLSHCRYKSVWVGFLYTVVLKVHLVGVWPKCPKKAWIHHSHTLPQWIEYYDQWSWYVLWSCPCVQIGWPQMCHLQIFSTDKEDVVLCWEL